MQRHLKYINSITLRVNNTTMDVVPSAPSGLEMKQKQPLLP
jgi:hypothetical protein